MPTKSPSPIKEIEADKIYQDLGLEVLSPRTQAKPENPGIMAPFLSRRHSISTIASLKISDQESLECEKLDISNDASPHRPSEFLLDEAIDRARQSLRQTRSLTNISTIDQSDILSPSQKRDLLDRESLQSRFRGWHFDDRASGPLLPPKFDDKARNHRLPQDVDSQQSRTRVAFYEILPLSGSIVMLAPLWSSVSAPPSPTPISPTASINKTTRSTSAP